MALSVASTESFLIKARTMMPARTTTMVATRSCPFNASSLLPVGSAWIVPAQPSHAHPVCISLNTSTVLPICTRSPSFNWWRATSWPLTSVGLVAARS